MAVNTGITKPIIHSFEGHHYQKINTINPKTIIIQRLPKFLLELGHTNPTIFINEDTYIVQQYTDEILLQEAMPSVVEANKTLKRKIPKERYKRNLLLRNYFQIKDAEAVIAVANYDLQTGMVEGGTGWGIQMALDRLINVYLFDLNSNTWLSSFNTNKILSVSRKPNIFNFNKVACIGARNLTQRGFEEIKSLFDNPPIDEFGIKILGEK